MATHVNDRTLAGWEALAAPLRAFIARRVPPEVEIDDVVQEVFLRIHAGLSDLRASERLDAWTFQIARNVLADAFRRRQRHQAFTARVDADEPAPPPEPEPAAVAELTGCLAPMVAQLPAPYREAIELTELAGLTQHEAARRVGISVSGMKSRVQRGRERLKAIVLACCAIELDARGAITGAERRAQGRCGDELRPSCGSRDSVCMKEATTPPNATAHSTTAAAATSTASTASAQATSPEGAPAPKAAGCCGGPAPAGTSACCALDAAQKQSGAAGCGCASKASGATSRSCC